MESLKFKYNSSGFAFNKNPHIYNKYQQFVHKFRTKKGLSTSLGVRKENEREIILVERSIR